MTTAISDNNKELLSKIDQLSNKVGRLWSVIDSLDNDVSDLKEEVKVYGIGEAPSAFITVETPDKDIEFNHVEAQQGLGLLLQIGLSPVGKYSLVMIEEIRLAVERVLR
jgi:hypothetical protein